jgi:PASTA domain
VCGNHPYSRHPGRNGSPRMTNKSKNRRLFHGAAWILGVAALYASHALWSQSASPTLNHVPMEKQRVQGIKTNPEMLPVPDLLWRSRQNAADALKTAGFNQGTVKDDGQDNSVVIEQSIAPGTQFQARSTIDYTLRRPTFVLKPSNPHPGVDETIHFTAVLTPNLPMAAGALSLYSARLSTIYTFTFYQNKNPDQPQASQAQRENTPATDHKFAMAGTYFVVVSAPIRGAIVTSDPFEIQVQSPTSVATPTPTSTSKKHPPISTPTKTHGSEPSTPPVESTINWTAVLKVLLLLVVVLGTVAVARQYYKWKSSPSPKAKVKVSPGNRQVQAKILEPQRLKSKCLTRIRWVRGPVCSRMLPQEKIVKKKGAAHG